MKINNNKKWLEWKKKIEQGYADQDKSYQIFWAIIGLIWFVALIASAVYIN